MYLPEHSLIQRTPGVGEFIDYRKMMKPGHLNDFQRKTLRSPALGIRLRLPVELIGFQFPDSQNQRHAFLRKIVNGTVAFANRCIHPQYLVQVAKPDGLQIKNTAYSADAFDEILR
jgi:hypothetical protein